MRLIKTIGGTSGAPAQCSKCGNQHFAKSGIAWHCTTCGVYHPTQLGFDSLKKHLEHADSLMKDFKLAIDDLERIVKE